MQSHGSAIDLGFVALKPSPGPEAKGCCKLQMFVSYPERSLSISQMEISCARKAIYQKPSCHRVKRLSVSKCLAKLDLGRLCIEEVTSGVNMLNFCSLLLCVLKLSHIIGLTLIAVMSLYS